MSEPSKKELAGPLKTKDPDSEEYAYQLVGLLETYAESLQTTLQEWDEIVEKAKAQSVHERLGYDSFDALLEDRIGHTNAEIRDGIRERTQRAAERSNSDMREQEDGRPKKRDNYNASSEDRGTDSSYLADRIDRDHPEVHEKMKAGEYRSVRQAAIDAGIIEDRTRVSFYADDPERACKNIFKHMVREDIKQLHSRLTDELDNAD